MTTTKVLPSRVPHPAEELVERSLKKQFPKLMSAPDGSRQGILDVIYMPGNSVRRETGAGVFQLVCDAATGSAVQNALGIDAVKGQNQLGQDELFIEHAALGAKLDILAQLTQINREHESKSRKR